MNELVFRPGATVVIGASKAGQMLTHWPVQVLVPLEWISAVLKYRVIPEASTK